MYNILHEQPIGNILACRLCGIQSLDTTFNNLLGEDCKNILFAIKKHLDIYVSDKDSHSKSVCQNCCKIVVEWSSFYEQCRNFQALLGHHANEADPSIISQSTSDPNTVTENLSNHFSKLVEELVDNGCLPPEKTTKDLEMTSIESHIANGDLQESAALSLEMDDETCVTEDEYEDDLTTEDECDSGQLLVNSKKEKQKTRHKKFVFDVPFLERKVGRSFSSLEKTKLLKYINKRQNTLICKKF